MRATAVLLLLALLAPSLAHAEVWKWTDSEGQTHYGDSPPSGVKASRVGDAGVSVIPASPPPDAAPTPAPPSAPKHAPAAEKAAVGGGSVDAAAEREAKRRRMIERCERERGVDCEDAVDGMLDGTPPPAHSVIEGPVWIAPTHPPHKPRPPVKPKPKPVTTDDPLNYPMAPFPKPVKPK